MSQTASDRITLDALKRILRHMGAIMMNPAAYSVMLARQTDRKVIRAFRDSNLSIRAGDFSRID
jgi:hypothetical protein